ncbi:Putative S-adenosyl-L-methionine-dependent methyltransferase yktD [Gossypium arboreum]|uniref:Putative S-adenosyl-L-methionine-dependent methyltransferase yktD n=1 Tax=Gossypium arboreum TaxID=29729 RepID=A0A0B0NR51_GOSAR|nr:Putative S-adenosyl-L-methionine-dependent methyltransferase yktD [Gossypium arboreum]
MGFQCKIPFAGAGAPPASYQGELQCPKISFSDHDNHDLNASNDSLDLWNASAENQLSVFDMLINDESEVGSERSLVHEAHVAFSVKGLGKIRPKTPLHSPKQEGRISSDDCSLPWNFSRQLNSLRGSNFVLNDIELEVDMDVPLGGSHSQFSVDITDSHGNWKPNLSTFSDDMQLDSHYRNSKCFFSDTDISYNIGREDIWDVSYQDDGFPHEREDDISWKYWPHKIDGNSGDFLDYENDPSPKHLSSKVGHDLTTLIWERYNPIQTDYDIRDFPAQPGWPFIETEDSKDSMSLLRGETIDSSPPNLMPRQSRRICSTFGRTRMKYDLDNDFGKETRCEDRDNLGQPSGKYMRTPVPHKSKATKRASYCLQAGIELSQKWLLEEGCNAVDIDLGFSSSHCTSQANLPSVGSQLWAEDPIGAFPVPELNLDVKSCFNAPKHSESIHCLPFSCFTSEKFAFCQPLNQTNSFDSPVFSNIRAGSIKHVLSPDSGRQGVPLDLFDADQHREIGFLDLSVRGRVNGDDKRKSRSPPTNCEQLEFEMENCFGNDLFLSKEPIVMGGSNPNNKEDEFKEAKDETLETKGSLGVKTSPSVKIHEKGESKGYECDVEIPLPCQSGTEQKEQK